MSTGVFVIVENAQGEILLGKRRDFPLWDLPGGTLEKNETYEECGIRECLEETGYIVTLTDFVGTFHRPEVDDIQKIYIGEVVGGEGVEKTSETEKLQWFSPIKLPWLMVPHRKKQIHLYLKGRRQAEVYLKEPLVIKLFQKH